MTNYNYYEAMYDDVCMYINENVDIIDYIQDGEFDREELENKLNDDCWIDDSVTGNASGSYYCNAYRAQEAVSGNINILVEALEEFGDDPDSYKQALKSPEYADVTIRCYLLSQVIASVLDSLETAIKAVDGENITTTEIVQKIA